MQSRPQKQNKVDVLCVGGIFDPLRPCDFSIKLILCLICICGPYQTCGKKQHDIVGISLTVLHCVSVTDYMFELVYISSDTDLSLSPKSNWSLPVLI